MNIYDFTVEETSLIAIYRKDTAAATLAAIDAALPDMDDEDIITAAGNASRKLAALTEQEFSALSFAPADETDG